MIKNAAIPISAENPDEPSATTGSSICEFMHPTPPASTPYDLVQLQSVLCNSSTDFSSAFTSSPSSRRWRRPASDHANPSISTHVDVADSILCKDTQQLTLAQKTGKFVTTYLSMLPESKQQLVSAKIIDIIHNEPIIPSDLS